MFMRPQASGQEVGSVAHCSRLLCCLDCFSLLILKTSLCWWASMGMSEWLFRKSDRKAPNPGNMPESYCSQNTGCSRNPFIKNIYFTGSALGTRRGCVWRAFSKCSGSAGYGILFKLPLKNQTKNSQIKLVMNIKQSASALNGVKSTVNIVLCNCEFINVKFPLNKY